jgi:hypothetical protein
VAIPVGIPMDVTPRDHLVSGMVGNVGLRARDGYALFTEQPTALQQGFTAYETMKHALESQIECCIRYRIPLSLIGASTVKLLLLKRCGDEITARSSDARFSDILRISPYCFPHSMAPVLLADPTGSSMGMIVNTGRIALAMMATTALEVHGIPTSLAALVASYINMDTA